MLSAIEEIKNRLDIVEVIGSYIKLQRVGANFRALCPFHSEKKPSFFVSPSRQIWHCFGCNLGGDIFKFVMQIEGIEFGDALRILASRAGVELKRIDPKLKTERHRLYEICELATKFFEKQLQESKSGKEAQKYLLSRKINQESIRTWRIGYAPNTREGLVDFLKSKGYRSEEIEKAGLGILKETGILFDRFRGRIIFPIFDLNSQVIGFGGRFFENPLRVGDGQEEIAKYINTPQTLLYDKSKVLYGLDKAKVEIRKRDSCILVEGYTDVIMAHQFGFKNVVATSGIALTPYQLKILKRYSENLLTAFDMDVAGDSATKRGINLAQSQGFNIKIICLPKDTDPAQVISQDLSGWEKALKEARSILEFYFESTFSKFDQKIPEQKKEISKILLPVIKRIPNRIEQAHWIQCLAKKLEVKEEDVEIELKKCSLENFGVPEPEESSTSRPKSRKELLEEKIISLLLKSPQKFSLIDENSLNYFSPQAQKALIYLKQHQNLNDFGDAPKELTDFLNYLALRSELEIEEEDLHQEIQACLKEHRSLEIKNKLDAISQEIKKAEEEKNFEKVNNLIQEFNKLTNDLMKL